MERVMRASLAMVNVVPQPALIIGVETTVIFVQASLPAPIVTNVRAVTMELHVQVRNERALPLKDDAFDVSVLV